MNTVSWNCQHCNGFNQSEINAPQELICTSCQKACGLIDQTSTIFESCPICQCRQFYIQKDFNRGLGCVIVLIGIILVPKTYGLSLPVVALIDWLLYKRFTSMTICYRCGAEYRGLPSPKHLKPYMHHIGLKYDKYR